MRKLISLSLALIMILSLAACGGNSNEPQSSPVPGDDVVVSPLPTPKPAETPAPTPEATPEPTPEPTPEITPTPVPEVTPVPESTPQPEATPEPTPEATPEATPDAAPIEQDSYAVLNSILYQLGGDMPAFMSGSADDLLNLYGIDASLVENFQLQIPMMMVHATEIFIAKVSPENMEAVKNGIALRKQNLLDQWSTYLPEQYDLVEKAQTVVSGDFVLFVVAPNADSVVSIFKSATTK